MRTRNSMGPRKPLADASNTPKKRGQFGGQPKMTRPRRALPPCLKACSPMCLSRSRNRRRGLVEVYPVRSEREVKELYLEYNKGENVREIDLPDAVAPDLKKFIDHAVDALANRFGVMFKPSERCRPPHVHRDTLRNALYHARVAERVESGAQLLELLLAANERLAGRPKKSWPAKLGAAYEKAKREKFYLGLDSLAWVETL